MDISTNETTFVGVVPPHALFHERLEDFLTTHVVGINAWQMAATVLALLVVYDQSKPRSTQ